MNKTINKYKNIFVLILLLIKYTFLFVYEKSSIKIDKKFPFIHLYFTIKKIRNERIPKSCFIFNTIRLESENKERHIKRMTEFVLKSYGFDLTRINDMSYEDHGNDYIIIQPTNAIKKIF